MKQDITMYSDCELSLLVFNDEYLYSVRHKRGFKGMIEELFTYTQDQLNELNQDLQDDLESLENEA